MKKATRAEAAKCKVCVAGEQPVAKAKKGSQLVASMQAQDDDDILLAAAMDRNAGVRQMAYAVRPQGRAGFLALKRGPSIFEMLPALVALQGLAKQATGGGLQRAEDVLAVTIHA